MKFEGKFGNKDLYLFYCLNCISFVVATPKEIDKRCDCGNCEYHSKGNLRITDFKNTGFRVDTENFMNDYLTLLLASWTGPYTPQTKNYLANLVTDEITNRIKEYLDSQAKAAKGKTV